MVVDAGRERDTPEIRFKGFTDAWEQRALTTFLTPRNERGYEDLPVLSASQDQGMIPRGELGKHIQTDSGSFKNYKRVCAGDFVIHLRSFQGGFAHAASTGITSPAYTVLGISDPNQSDRFWRIVFSSNKFIKSLETVTYGIRDGRSIDPDEALMLSPMTPFKREQDCLSKLVERVETLLALHQRKQEKLQQLKKSLLESMFPSENCDRPAIRFAGFTDAWEQRALGEIAKRVTERNTALTFKQVFTNSAVHGVIPQSEYFEHEVANQQNITGYTVVRPNDLVYNPRISTSAPVGPINVNFTGITGVVSPLYLVFRPNENSDLRFLSFYFTANTWHRFMFRNGNSGARSDRFSIAEALLLELPVRSPSLSEQKAVASVIHRLDCLLALHQRKQEKLQQLKKALLEKMFV